jgi:hypothetical protein
MSGTELAPFIVMDVPPFNQPLVFGKTSFHEREIHPIAGDLIRYAV